MANFDQLADRGRTLFLGYDQREMLRRFPMESDAGWIYVNFCGEPLQLDRQTGVLQRQSGEPAGPAAMLSVYDMLCRTDDPPGLSGAWRATNGLSGIAQSNPDSDALLRPWAVRFERDPEQLRRACRARGGIPFPVGDVAYELRVFDWFPTVLQFWQGEEEFPSALRFLWDAHALCYLHFESLYYIMDELLRNLMI